MFYKPVYSFQFYDFSVPADYAITQMEALTILCHYCLLDSAQPFNQPIHGAATSTAVSSQIFNNLVHVFIPSPVTVRFSYLIFYLFPNVFWNV